MNIQINNIEATINTTGTNRESDDDYRDIVVQFNNDWRLIKCKDDIQWIIQYPKKSGHKRVWRGRSYHRTSKSLKRVLTSLKIEINPHAQLIIDSLPSHIEIGGLSNG